jgi:uncharacterized lipoprotein
LNPVLRPLLLAGLSCALAGCGYIAGLFPDKQKQYRYSTELPPLEIPPDLTGSTIEGRDDGDHAERSRQTRETVDDSAPPKTDEREQPRKEVSRAAGRQPAKSAVPKTSLAQNQEDAPLIEVEAPFAETWNDVSRALGRLEVELTDQNRSDGVFYVYYGGDTPHPKDGETSFWQDVKSLFGAGEKAGEYRVKLEESGDYTHVFVLDAAGKAVTEGRGFELLKRLNDALVRLDQPEPENEQEK